MSEKSFSTEIAFAPSVQAATKQKQTLLLSFKVTDGERLDVTFNGRNADGAANGDAKAADAENYEQALKEIEALKAELRQEKEEKQKSEEDCAAYLDRIATLRTEHDDTKDKNETLTAENEKLRAQVKKLEAAAGDVAEEEMKRIQHEMHVGELRLSSIKQEYQAYKDRAEAEIKTLLDIGVKSQINEAKMLGTTAKRNDVIELAKEEFEDLRAWVGVNICSEPSAGVLNGLQVVKVVPEGPAEGAGFLCGDIIESANGAPLKINSDFRKIINQVKAGDTVSFQINRGNEFKYIALQVASRDLDFQKIQQLRRIAQNLVLEEDYQFIDELTAGDDDVSVTR